MVKEISILDNGFSLLEFHSSLLVLLPKELVYQFSLSEKLRLLIRSIRGYSIYYIMDVENMVGYCCMKHNYLGKYSFMADEDVIINPYYVCDCYRGHHYGQTMIRYALDRIKKIWECLGDSG